MSNLSLTQEELDFLIRAVSREYFRIARLSKAVQDSKENQTTIKLKNKLSQEITLNRVEARILQKLAENFILITRTQTQPEMDRRVDEFPQSAAKYAPYQKELDDKLSIVIELSNKIGELL